MKLDAHIKSPFYIDLGIQEFRNFELLKAVGAKGITQNPELSDFLHGCQVYISFVPFMPPLKALAS